MLLLLVSSALTANAKVTDIHVEQTAVPEEIVPGGFIANDLLIDFEGNLRGQQLYLSLDEGEVYYAPLSCNPILCWPVPLPNSNYGTRVLLGDLDQLIPDLLIIGGAVDIPGASSALEKTETQFNAAWAPGTGVDIPRGERFITARLTLSPDARGSLAYFGSTSGGGQPLIEYFEVVDGIVRVPEPTAITLLGLGLMASIIRWRCMSR